MTEMALEFNGVWKKFKKGEKYDSLRDLIPAMTKKLLLGNHHAELQEREFWALKDVTFQVKSGEALGIIGPNGSGKSTILKLLSGILRPNKGNIKVNGRLSALIEVGAGFHPDLTGRENVYLNGAILGMTKKVIDNKFDEIVAFSDLEEFINTPVKRYSSGMYARLGFSVAAHVDPEVLLVDEVLSVGDFTFQHKCIKRMKEIVEKGVTVIFISHNLPSVIDLCPKTILLNRGEIQKYDETKGVCRYYYNAYAEMLKITEGKDIWVSKINVYSNGSSSTSFKPGDWATLDIEVTSEIDVDNLCMGFLVKRNDGLMVFDANSDKVADIYYSFKKGETKKINVAFRINLPRGTYFLGVHFRKPGGGFFFYNDELIEFYVNAASTLGSAFLDLKWKV